MKNTSIRFHWSIDQLQILSNNLDLDIIDWSIYEVMKQFFLSGNCEKRQFDGKFYYRYEWQNIPDQAPILKISTKQAVYKRYDKLISANLLCQMPLPDGTISKRFFCFGDMHEVVMNTQGSKEKAVSEKENYSNKNKKLGASNTVNARLDRKQRFTPVNDGLQNTLLSVNDGLQKEPKSVNDGLLYNNINIDNRINLDKNIITQPDGSGFLSSDEIADLESQLTAKKREAQTPPRSAAPPAKRKAPASKWNGSFGIAQRIFDEQRKLWSIKRFNIADAGLVWNGKEHGQLSNLLTMLKSKALSSGASYESDIEFVETELPVFLGAAAQLNKYYSNDFTPTLFSSKFNTVVIDIQNFLKNGNTSNNGRNGHNFDAERTRYMESLLD